MKYGELTLGQTEAIVNKLGGMDGVRRFLSGCVEIVFKKVLFLVTMVATTAVKSFVAQNKFRIGETDGVKIGWLGENFKKNFLSVVEVGVAGVTLRIHRLEKDSLDAPILEELGETMETALARMWGLLKKQGHGQKGALLVNGYANIFYLRDVDNEL